MNTKYLHYRAVDESAKSKTNPHGILSRTGATVAYAQEEGKPIVYSAAYCHPYDNFSKGLGRAKAGGRLRSPAYRVDTSYTERNDFIEEMNRTMAEYGYTRLDSVKK